MTWETQNSYIVANSEKGQEAAYYQEQEHLFQKPGNYQHLLPGVDRELKSGRVARVYLVSRKMSGSPS